MLPSLLHDSCCWQMKETLDYRYCCTDPPQNGYSPHQMHTVVFYCPVLETDNDLHHLCIIMPCYWKQDLLLITLTAVFTAAKSADSDIMLDWKFRWSTDRWQEGVTEWLRHWIQDQEVQGLNPSVHSNLRPTLLSHRVVGSLYSALDETPPPPHTQKKKSCVLQVSAYQ